MVVDDEFSIRESFSLILSDNYKVILSASGEAALKKLADERVDVVYLDIRMPGMDGLETLKRLKDIERDVTVIMVTAVNDVQKAGEAIKLGAKDYVVKPFDVSAILAMTEDVLKKRVLSKETKEVRGSAIKPEEEDLIGGSRAIEKVRSRVGEIAQKDSNVVILGEAGVEKERVARLVHSGSKRAAHPFISCTIKNEGEEAIRALLFGRGGDSFTGTLEKGRGLLEEAEGGTLYLSNIESIPPVVQKELGICLRKGEFLRRDLGTSVKINARVIAATSSDLKTLTAEGHFSKELYEAIGAASITMPPLRARAADIPEMAQHLVDRCNWSFGRSIRGFSKDSVEALQGYSFPGNADELEKMIEEISLAFDGDEIPLSKIPLNVLLNSASLKGLEEANGLTFDAALDKLERAHIGKVLLASKNDRAKAAKVLKLTQNSLSAKMESLDIPG